MRFPAPIALPLLAAGLAAVAGTSARAGVLTVPLNHSVKLALAGRAGSVVVGNSRVADVTVVDTRTVFVTGKAPGSTDVTVVDPLGRTVYAADVLVSAGPGRQVTVHRAGVASSASCSPRCLPVDPEAARAVQTASAPEAANPGAAGAAAGAMIGSAVGAGLGQAAAAGPLGLVAAPAPR